MLKKYCYMRELRLKLSDCVLANLGSNFNKNECKENCLQNRKISQDVARRTIQLGLQAV